MVATEETWTGVRDKAEKSLDGARFLFDHGQFDGASILAAGSCMQIAYAVSLRNTGERDHPDWITRIRQMMKDGRLPEEAAKPFMDIVWVHGHELRTSKSRDFDYARDMIALAETFHRMMWSSADLTAHRQSPKVCKAIKAKGINLPYAPFAK